MYLPKIIHNTCLSIYTYIYICITTIINEKGYEFEREQKLIYGRVLKEQRTGNNIITL